LNFMLGGWYGAKITSLRGHMTNTDAPDYAASHPEDIGSDNAKKVAEITQNGNLLRAAPGRTAGKRTSRSTRPSGRASRPLEHRSAPMPGGRSLGLRAFLALPILFVAALSILQRDDRFRSKSDGGETPRGHFGRLRRGRSELLANATQRRSCDCACR
jgi:hypothetical protein